MIEKDKKSKIISDFGICENDTGSVEVQVAVLTERIKNITEHVKIHKKDFITRRGLLMLVSRRKKLLAYLKSTNMVRFTKLITRLNLKDNK
ncbi:MAG: 30S ribosomal protein S15 [Rickettsiales bacterium]|jgi:small subunit ribosomal protein S15|nr:30S ribosomal protein S15 [Rickettsiales bacterium]